MAHNFMKPFLKLSLILVCIALAIGTGLSFFPKSIHDVAVSGSQFQSQRWSGTVTIIGDTLFMPWLTLTIEPGTKVWFKKEAMHDLGDWTKYADAYIKDHNDPTGHEGYEKSHYDLTARIIAIGTEESPISLTALGRQLSPDPSPKYAAWDQLSLFSGSHLSHVIVEDAHNGITIEGSDVIVENSRVDTSLWSCIDIFSTGNTIARNDISHCWHQAIGVKVPGLNMITENTIHDAQLSVNCENGADPLINLNLISAAPLGSDCPKSLDNIIEDRPADVPGGLFEGKLIYPAS